MATESPSLPPTDAAVTLISQEGTKFVCPLELARFSGTLKAMLDSGSAGQEVHLKNIPAKILEYVVAYFAYRQKYTDLKEPAEIPEFPICGEDALDVLIAANFLDV